MKKITGVLVNVQDGTASRVTIDKSLDAYYAALDCTCIDIITRYIGGKSYDIICDDEGLLRSDARVSALTSMGVPMLVGNLFIVKFNGSDDVCSLSKDDVVHILKHCTLIRTAHNEPVRRILRCEYGR